MQSFIFDDAIRFRLATQQEDTGAKIQVFFGVFLGVILRWIIALVRATRELDETIVGGSVRASLALERVGRARALLDGRDFVQPADVEALFLPVLAHRVAFTPAFLAEARRVGRDEALAEFQRLCFERAPRPEPDAEHELRVLGTPA